MGGGGSAGPIAYMGPVEGDTPSDPKKDSATYRCSLITSDHTPVKELTKTQNTPEGKPCVNCYDIFLNGMAASKNSTCTGTVGKDGQFAWKTYAEFHQLALEIGSGLIAKGAVTEETFEEEKYAHQKKFRFIGIYSKNREEWAATELASNAYGMTLVPLYDTLGPESVVHICKQTKLKAIVTQGSNIVSLLNVCKEHASEIFVKLVIAIDAVTEEMQTKAKDAKIELITWEELRTTGKADLKPVTPVSDPKCINTICYTSGTTGLPKGAFVTHQQLVSSATAALQTLVAFGIPLDGSDVYLSYLPFAHILERIVVTFMMSRGASVGFYRGDTTRLVEDIQLLRPTLFASVPRLYARIYDKINAKVEAGGALKKMLFNQAMSSKIARLRSTGQFTHAFWDAIVFGNTKKVLGGRVKLMITGSAPINGKVHEFLKCAFCAPFCEGYGLTETTGGSFLSHPNETSTGTIGGCLPCVEVKLVSLPDMEYTVMDKTEDGQSAPRGEVCMRGPGVFPGYFLDEKNTAEALDADGWMHTGDIGQILPSGMTKIVDRKKNIFKLSQGEYIAPEKVEGVYAQAPLIAQAFVYGSSQESVVVAIFVVSEDDANLWAKSHNKPADVKALLTDEDFKKAVEKQMLDVAVSNKLTGLEKVKNFRLIDELFSVENDLITPTFKLKRFQASKKYKAEIDAMYEELAKKQQQK